MRAALFLAACSVSFVAIGALVSLGCGSITASATTGPDLTDSGAPVVLPDGAVVALEAGPDGSLLTDSSAPPVTTDGGFCQGSGPVISIPGANTQCTGDIGATTFLFAVCSCKDVSVSGALFTDSLPTTPGGSNGSGGSIGTNGSLSTNSMLNIGGSVYSAATGETLAVHVMQSGAVFGDIHAGASIEADQSLTIADDLLLNGNATGTITCNAATLPTGATAPGVTASGGITRAPVTVAPPCDCTNTLDIPSIVSSFAAASANSDSAAGLTEGSFAAFPATPVTLPCGQYYFDGIGGTNPITLTIGGRAAIFVNGDFSATQALNLSLAAGAELDLFISGNLILSDAMLGSSTTPARVRIYVGGTTLTLSGTATIGANLYAPNANVALASDFTMAGSLFVGSLQLSGAFTIHYDESILSTTGCAQSGGSCTTCHQCSGATPSCNAGTCGPCKVDADCCAPLRCNQGLCIDQIP